MGAGASSSASDEDRQLQDVENRLGIDLPLLKAAFCRLAHVNAAQSDPQQFSVHLSELEECFDLKSSQLLPDESTSDLRKLVPHLGAALASMFFRTRELQVRWIDFLNGYDACFQPRTRLKTLLACFRELESRAGISSEKLGAEEKLEPHLSQRELEDFLRLCWLLMYYGRRRCLSQLIDVSFLVNGAFSAAKAEDISLDAACSWMTSNIPKVANALALYVRVRLESSEERDPDPEPEPAVSTGLLTRERAWALGLSQNDQTGDALLYQSQTSLLYRSSVHGKGMNRFWAQVEGYKSTAMLLVSMDSTEGGSPWVIGVIMPAGLENKSSFYGSASSCLVAVEPKFAVFRARGLEKNYVYTYKAVAGGGYVSKPMPNGVGFGGSLGHERLWMNDDFSTLTLRHYANDKTYQAGFLTPKEGYAPIELPILDVELWGLGGKDAEEHMLAFQKRENLFSEQRRKVDLKAFGDWQDSPEKMMMDMVSDPNTPQRERR